MAVDEAFRQTDRCVKRNTDTNVRTQESLHFCQTNIPEDFAQIISC